ncbi:hypothetical protein ACUTGP_29045, partial [Klebsiella pneumoniae]|uniref:hypothetical protein n=1 Tax=Klebsiella pneumoniae TaxID=573 RepID=UPI0040465E7E
MAWAMGYLGPVLERAWPWLYAVPPDVLRWTLLGLSVVVMTWCGGRIYTKGLAGLVRLTPDMNTLVAIGTGAGFAYSLLATV